MTLDQLRYFLAASKFEHVGKAARSVHISPGAVSTAILALEEELGGELFRRHRRRIYLNPRGKYLREQAEQLMERLNVIRGKLQSGRVEIQGSYRLGGSHFLASRFLAGAWTDLLRENALLSGEVCALATASVISEVLRGAMDFGLCFSPLTHPDLHAIVLRRGHLLLTVGRRHPLLRVRSRLDLARLSAYPAAIHKSAPGVDVCDSHPNFARYGIVPNIAFMFDSDDLAIENLKESRAWSLLPDIVIRRSEHLAALPHPADWRAPYDVALVCRKAQQHDVVFQMLRRKLEARFG
jgi:DNA-binding transcriptional LysR family regulator